MSDSIQRSPAAAAEEVAQVLKYKYKDLNLMIKTIFEKRKHQMEIVFDLYRLAIPDWDNVAKCDGHPKINEEHNRLIFRLFGEVDRKNHPGVIPGGAWLNWGFSTDNSIPDNEIHTEAAILTYK